jgi:hypothetical protein
MTMRMMRGRVRYVLMVVALIADHVFGAPNATDSSTPTPVTNKTKKRVTELPRCQSHGATSFQEHNLKVRPGQELFAGYAVRVPNPQLKHTKVTVGEVSVDYTYECPDGVQGIWSCAQYSPPPMSCNAGTLEATCIHNVSSSVWFPTDDYLDPFSYSLSCKFPPLCSAETRPYATIVKAVMSASFRSNPSGDVSFRFRYGLNRLSTGWSDEFRAEARKYCRLTNREEDEAKLQRVIAKKMKAAEEQAKMMDEKAFEEAKRKKLAKENRKSSSATKAAANCVEAGTCSNVPVYETSS